MCYPENNGRGDALRRVGRGKPVSNNTKPTPVKVVASEKIPRPLRARDYESAAYCKFPRLLCSKCCPFSTDSSTKIHIKNKFRRNPSIFFTINITQSHEYDENRSFCLPQIIPHAIVKPSSRQKYKYRWIDCYAHPYIGLC